MSAFQNVALAARAWPPEAVETLGGWRLHASSGFSGRSNCCWPIGAPDRPLEAAVDAAEAWYAARGLPPLFKPVDAPTSEPLIQALAARGYRPRTPTLVMTGPLADGDAGPALVSDLVGEGFAGLFAAVQDDPADAAERIGFLGVRSGPLVRSSYRAGRLWGQAMRRRGEEIPPSLAHLAEPTSARQEARSLLSR